MAKNILVVEKILSTNDRIATENRGIFNSAGIKAFNIMASPGAGKTSLIEQTIKQLLPTIRLAVIDGDIATSIDADRAQAAGAQAVQIHTGGECHLDANMVRKAFDEISLSAVDLLIVENVGNLVCPASFRLGTHKNIVVASIPERDDKPYKYPGMYSGMDILILNRNGSLTVHSFPDGILPGCWRAQQRLHHRYRHLVGNGRRVPVAVAAVARELVGFVWAAMTQRPVAA